MIPQKHYVQLERLACLCVAHDRQIVHEFWPKIAQQMAPIRIKFLIFFHFLKGGGGTLVRIDRQRSGHWKSARLKFYGSHKLFLQIIFMIIRILQNLVQNEKSTSKLSTLIMLMLVMLKVPDMNILTN